MVRPSDDGSLEIIIALTREQVPHHRHKPLQILRCLAALELKQRFHPIATGFVQARHPPHVQQQVAVRDLQPFQALRGRLDQFASLQLGCPRRLAEVDHDRQHRREGAPVAEFLPGHQRVVQRRDVPQHAHGHVPRPRCLKLDHHAHVARPILARRDAPHRVVVPLDQAGRDARQGAILQAGGVDLAGPSEREIPVQQIQDHLRMAQQDLADAVARLRVRRWTGVVGGRAHALSVKEVSSCYTVPSGMASLPPHSRFGRSCCRWTASLR